MRIAMLGHKRIPSREGGVEIVVEELSVRMAQRGHDVTCYNRSGHHVSGRQFDAEKRRSHKGIRLVTVPAIDIKGIAAMTASLFASILAAFGRYDVVHFHTEGPCATLWIPKLFRKRCVVTVHGLDHQRAKWGRFARTYIMLGEKCAARFADEIIVLSEGVQAYFRRTYGRETKLIPNGIHTVVPRPALQIIERYGIKKDEYILFLGRMTPEKGIHYLIEAFRQIETDKKLIIAGGSSDSDSYFAGLKQMAADDPRIVFTGFVQGEMLEELYSNAYAYVLPSDLEGMPLTLLEALSYGNCCLVSDIPENADVVGNIGMTFRRGDVLDLRNSLMRIVHSSDLVDRYRASVRNMIGKMPDWNCVTEETLKLYGGDRP